MSELKLTENYYVSDLVQLLWGEEIIAKNRVSDFSGHSRFQSRMLKKRQSLRFGSLTMGKYFFKKMTESQIWFTYYGKIFFRKNDRVSDLVHLLWENIFLKK